MTIEYLEGDDEPLLRDWVERRGTTTFHLEEALDDIDPVPDDLYEDFHTYSGHVRAVVGEAYRLDRRRP
jgi:hypothetical protein